MTSVRTPPDAKSGAPFAEEARESLWRRTPTDVRLLAAMLLVAVIAYTWLGSRNEIPQVFPDEFLYGGMARSLANGDGLAYRDASQGLFSALYVIAIAPAWVLGSDVGAYNIAKFLNAVYISLTAVPVWFLARRLADERAALVAAALTLLGSWMLYAGQLVTENVALPLAVGALCATVLALREPSSRWWMAAAGLTAGAALARVHMASLVAVLVVAPLMDALRQPGGARRERLAQHRAWLLASVAIAFAGGLVVIGTGGGALGRYESLENVDTGMGDLLGWAGRHALALVVSAGIVPAVAALALAMRARNWRDDDTGPLLVVIGSAALVLLALAGWFVGSQVQWLIERYVVYVAPLMIVALVVAPRRIGLRAGMAAATGVTVALLAIPTAETFAEARAVLAARDMGGKLFSERPGIGVALFAMALGAAAVLLLSRPPPPPATKGRRVGRAKPPPRPPLAMRLGREPGLVVAGLVAVALVLNTAWGADRTSDYFATQRDNLPAELAWVDQAAESDHVAFIAAEQRTSHINFITELLNRKIDAAYAFAGVPTRALGRNCGVVIADDGSLTTEPGCPPVPRELVVEDSITRIRFQNEEKRVESVYAGDFVRVRGKAPRMLSLVAPSCNSRLGTCTGYITLRLWLPRETRISLTFSGSAKEEQVAVPGDRVYKIPPNAASRLNLQVPKGKHELALPVSWKGFDGPELDSVSLGPPGNETALY